MAHNKIPFVSLSPAPGVSLFHTGPALDHGPLPSLFYFALSGEDSLSLDPFNQPVAFLHGKMIRVFSMTLPGHENGLPAAKALSVWADDFSKGVDCIGEFLEQAEKAVSFAIREKFADPSKLAFAGLSRGGMIAAHLAARVPACRFLLAFAPLTKLKNAKEFSELKHHPLAESFDLERIAPALCNRHVRLYIGNHDTRVGTKSCFDFAMSLVESAREHKVRVPQIELFISPSIGHMGHGTPPEIFHQGAHWIAECLK